MQEEIRKQMRKRRRGGDVMKVATCQVKENNEQNDDDAKMSCLLLISERLFAQQPHKMMRRRSTTISTRRRLSIREALIIIRILAAIASFNLILQLGAHFGDAAKLPDIYWNSSNPIFRIDNTDHIFDVNKKLHDHDQVDLVCPQAPPTSGGADTNQNRSSESAAAASTERYIIYSVSKDEYDTCRLNGPGARAVAICDQQQAAGKAPRPPITITFRSFTPQPNGLEFKPGQDYYFITALHQSVGGGGGGGQSMDQARRFAPCREQNMKVIFKICCKNTSGSGSSTLTQALTSSGSTTRKPQVKPTRPPVITVRPTFKPASIYTQEYQQQQQQPVTVLPIEVNEASSSPATSIEAASSTGSNSPQADNFQEQQTGSASNSPNQDIKNDIQNEQPAHLPPLVFDPRAPPSQVLRGRDYGPYAPTPLPPQLISPPSLPAQQFNAGGPPKLMLGRDNLQLKLPAWQSQGADWPPAANAAPSTMPTIQNSRIQYYPWKNSLPSAVQTSSSSGSTQLFTVAQQQHQQPPTLLGDHQRDSSATIGAPTWLIAGLAPLLLLVILLALGLERRYRYERSSASTSTYGDSNC